MSSRIVISIYEEERISGDRKLKYTDVILTPLKAGKVLEFLNINDGFSATVTEGAVLSFVDFSCITVSVDDVIKRIREVPVTDEGPELVLPVYCRLFISQQSNEDWLKRSEQELVYTCQRFECGAGSFGEMVIEWASAHPIEMVFIGGAVYDGIKWLLTSCKKGWQTVFGRKKGIFEYERNMPIRFSPRKFQKNVSRMMNMDFDSFQVIGITPVRRGKHAVRVRTDENRIFKFLTNINGDILSFEEES